MATTKATKATKATSIDDIVAEMDADLPATTGAKAATVEKTTLQSIMPKAANEIIAQANARGRTGLRAATVTRDLNGSVVRQAQAALETLADVIRAKAANLSADDLAAWAKVGSAGTRTGETRVTVNVSPARVDGVWSNANISITLEGTLSRALAPHAAITAADQKKAAKK